MAGSSILHITILAALGTAVGGSAGWAFSRHDRLETNAAASRGAIQREAGDRIRSGSLEQTLDHQKSLSALEISAARQYLEAANQSLAESAKSSAAHLEKERQIVATLSSGLEDLTKKSATPQGTDAAKLEQLKEQAKQSAGITEDVNHWAELRAQWAAASARLDQPVQDKDMPSLETEVSKLSAIHSFKNLPAADKWESARKAALADWLKKNQTP